MARYVKYRMPTGAENVAREGDPFLDFDGLLASLPAMGATVIELGDDAPTLTPTDLAELASNLGALRKLPGWKAHGTGRL